MTLSYLPSTPAEMSGHRRSIGIWTAGGVPAWAAESYRRIYERELLRRLPDSQVRFIGHLADDTAVVSERGDVITSLADCEASGATLDGIVAAGVPLADIGAFAQDLAGQSPAPAIPYVLSALAGGDAPFDARLSIARTAAAAADVSVRDSRSLECLRSLEIAGPVGLVPDPLVLLSRLTSPGTAGSRLEYLRTMDGYPHAEIVLVEVAESRVAHLAPLGEQVARARARGYRVAVVALTMDEERFTDALRRRVEEAIASVHCADRICLEDRAAILSTAAAVVPLSAELLAAACAFGRPSLWCSGAAWDRDAAALLPGGDRLIRDSLDRVLQIQPDPSLAGPACVSLAVHFDQIAAHLSAMPVAASTALSSSAGRFMHLATANRVAGRRLADERLRFAERAEGLLDDLARLQREGAHRSALETALREELAGVVAHARHETARADQSLQRVWQLEARIAQLEAANAGLTENQVTLAARLDALSGENAAQAEIITDLTGQREELRGAVDRFARSRSWRYLAPARAFGRIVRRAFNIKP